MKKHLLMLGLVALTAAVVAAGAPRLFASKDATKIFSGACTVENIVLNSTTAASTIKVYDSAKLTPTTSPVMIIAVPTTVANTVLNVNAQFSQGVVIAGDGTNTVTGFATVRLN